MNRRGFLRSFLLGAAASSSGVAVGTPTKRLLIQKTQINGMAYYAAGKIFDQLSYDDPVQLRREPGNLYDAQAVEVLWEGSKLGYVPRLSNFALAKMLDEGEKITACIAELDSLRLPYAGIEIEITWEG